MRPAEAVLRRAAGNLLAQDATLEVTLARLAQERDAWGALADALDAEAGR